MVQTKLLLAMAGPAAAGIMPRQGSATASASATTSTGASTTVPQYFQITPQIYNGFTTSGVAPFLAQTNPAPFMQSTYVAPDPLETGQPIVGNNNSDNIFHYMGQLSHYFPNPSGFGVDEMPIPSGANITWLNMLSRHGSRYPTSNSAPQALGQSIPLYRNNGTKFSGNLSFLNNWNYALGAEVMVGVGKSELFDSGVLHFYNYGHLWNRSKPLVMRTTTQERMRQSAENFAAGFGGDINFLAQNITIEYVIEQNGFNDSMAGYYQCPQSNANVSSQGDTAARQWEAIYLKNAVQRFNNMTSGGYNWTTSTVYAAQQSCPYETVGLGYSAFCDLFTFEEWEGYEYSVDLSFAGDDMFQSPTGRGVGIGYVQEVLARLNHHYITTGNTNDNTTLDSMPSTFPLNQTIYFDFSHDTNIASILTAFNFTQFSPVLNQTAIQRNRSLIVSHMEPFGARLDIDVINSPSPISPNRTASSPSPYVLHSVNSTTPTQYIRFRLNQRTVPLFPGYPACGNRTDGWCDLPTFLNSAAGLLDAARYDYSCFGNYSAVPYGSIHNGVPIN